ncbi:hypothetical protein SCLCIDRAFT_124110 [Scleroderma citrinum Foug A]|uniref:Tc1-like transposase DDE domain-containing protein n=1 Tax=Scleroderma citrinum Foug A TaxID=1036808 RepID=A0A0C3DX97_9AGAM|nr:hypothetical protein SCLCIDRAFT_124110 [Scleroderma citrinum Foug A]
MFDLSTGCILLFLPPYSPDLNPIEESFITHVSTVKAYLRCHAHQIRGQDDPVATLIEATSCVTADKCQGWVHHAGYIM